MYSRLPGVTILLCATLLSAGCGTAQIKRWSKPGASEAQKE